MARRLNQPPPWAGQYVGIPFVDLGRDRGGCDCWGLVRLVIAERTGFVLPSLDTGYGSETNVAGVVGEVDAARANGEWLKIEPGQERTLDVVEMSLPARVDGHWVFAPLHVGIVVASGWLLHIERATASAACPLQ